MINKKFKLCIKYFIYLQKSVEKIQKLKILRFQGLKTEVYNFYQNVPYTIVKYINFSKNKKLKDY